VHIAVKADADSAEASPAPVRAGQRGAREQQLAASTSAMICVQTGILRGPPTRMTRRGLKPDAANASAVAASRAPCDHQSTAQLPERVTCAERGALRAARRRTRERIERRPLLSSRDHRGGVVNVRNVRERERTAAAERPGEVSVDCRANRSQREHRAPWSLGCKKRVDDQPGRQRGGTVRSWAGIDPRRPTGEQQIADFDGARAEGGAGMIEAAATTAVPAAARGARCRAAVSLAMTVPARPGPAAPSASDKRGEERRMPLPPALVLQKNVVRTKDPPQPAVRA